jgi:hypothetical protein
MDILDYIYLNGEKKPPPPPKKDTKTDVPGYYKTPVGAVVSKDYEGLKAYKARKMKQVELNTMKNDISELKQDLAEIKELLRGIKLDRS